MVLVDGDDVNVENVTVEDDDVVVVKVMTIAVVMTRAVMQVDQCPVSSARVRDRSIASK